MTAASNSEPNASRAMLRRVAVASCIGTTVEWYDFFIYTTAALLTLLFIRLLHGFGIGGEQGNAILITIEHAPLESRGYFGSWVQNRRAGGVCVAARAVRDTDGDHVGCDLLGVGLAHSVSAECLLIVVGLYIRMQLSEGVIALGHSAMYGPQAAFFAELFPTRLHATGIAFVQQIGALIGSVGGLAAGWLLAFGDGTPWLLAGYVALIGLATLACTLLLPETALRASGARMSGQPAPSSY